MVHCEVVSTKNLRSRRDCWIPDGSRGPQPEKLLLEGKEQAGGTDSPAPQRVLRAVLSAKFQDLLKSKFTAEGAAIYEEDNTTSIHPAEPAPGKHSCAVASIVRLTMHGNTEPNDSE